MTSSAIRTGCHSYLTNPTYHIWMHSLVKSCVLSVKPHWRLPTQPRGTRPLLVSWSRGTRPSLLISGPFITILIVGEIHFAFGQSGSWTNKVDCVWRVSCLTHRESARVRESLLPGKQFSCTLRDCCTDFNLRVHLVPYCLTRMTVIMESCLSASLLRSVPWRDEMGINESTKTEEPWTAGVQAGTDGFMPPLVIRVAHSLRLFTLVSGI